MSDPSTLDPISREKGLDSEKEKLVTILDESESPKRRSKLQRWVMTIIVSLSSTCVTFNSSLVSHQYFSIELLAQLLLLP